MTQIYAKKKIAYLTQIVNALIVRFNSFTKRGHIRPNAVLSMILLVQQQGQGIYGKGKITLHK